MARAFMVAVSAAISATGGRNRFIRESRGHLPPASGAKKSD
jgi:hypothetical protein